MEELEKYYNRALRFLSYRPRSEKEVRDNLLSKGRSASGRKKPSPELIETIIKKLKEQKFLNDEEFVKWWVEQRTVHRPKGMRAIKMELRQKGVPSEMIDRITENQESGIGNQGEILKRLIEKKLPRYGKLEKSKQYQKLTQFLARRGFDYDIIKQGLDEVLGRDYNQQ